MTASSDLELQAADMSPQQSQKAEVNSQAQAEAGSGSEKPNGKPASTLICVVPGCTTDVSSGPHYLRRHKICQLHLKARAVRINGDDVRFCQQCGRFQPLADFKDNQRSCEAALQAHNARRRVKKDANSTTWSSERKGRGSKRAAGADDPSSSEDGGVGASRKSAQPRKSSSQRSAPSNLQQSAAGSDSFRGAGSEGNDRPLSDGARTVEQNAWTSHASPDNSYGSPAEQQQQQLVQPMAMQLPGLLHMGSMCAGASHSGSPAVNELDEQQQQLLYLLQPSTLPEVAGSFQQPGMLQTGFGANGSSMLAAGHGSMGGMQFGLPGDLCMPACCGAFTSLMQDKYGPLGMPAMSSAQAAMAGPSLSCNPAGPSGSGTLESWMMPQHILQQQQAQLQQYLGPAGAAGFGEAMGQSMLLQQAMQEQQQQKQQQQHQQQQQQQQMLMMSQQPYQQQPGLQVQMQQLQMSAHAQPLQQQQQQQQQSNGLGGSFKSSINTDSTGTNLAPGDTSGQSGNRTDSVSPFGARTAPVSSTAAVLPAPSAAAAAALLAKEPLDGLMPVSAIANSSCSLSLLDGLATPLAGPGAAAAAAVGGSGTNMVLDEDALLDQALEVLLCGPDWQMDDVLLGPRGAVQSGTNSAAVRPATTSSPSSSNINGASNLSGPLSVPSLPSATNPGQSLLLSAQQSATGRGMVAGLVPATDAMWVGSPSKAPTNPLLAASASQMQSSLVAAGGSMMGMGAIHADLDDLLPPVSAYSVTATAGMDLAMSAPLGGGSVMTMSAPVAADTIPCAGGPSAGMHASMFASTGVAAAQMGGLGLAVSTAPGMFQSSTAAHGMMNPSASGGMPAGATAGGLGSLSCAMPAAPAAAAAGMLNGMALGAGSGPGTLNMAAAGPVGLSAQGPGFTQMDQSYPGMPGGQQMHQTLWQHQQQHQQQQESLLLQQQLMMQQQQQAEYLLLQQQQQLQRRQQLMRLQQQINSQMTYSQQLVRLSIKLHGVTPDQLPCSTVLAMERLLVNNAADIEMILLQPSLRQGCIQFELDVLVNCPQLEKPDSSAAAAARAPARTTSAASSAAENLFESDEPESCSSQRPKPHRARLSFAGMAAVVAALNCNVATSTAEAQLRRALPFDQLVSVLLDLPLMSRADGTQGSSAASSVGSGCPSSDPDSDSGCDDSGSDASSDEGSFDSSSSIESRRSLRSCATAIYAQVGNCLGVWRSGSGVVQDWDTELDPSFTFSAAAAAPAAGDSVSKWRPVIKTCMPLVSAAADASAASSPTAAAAAEQAHGLVPLPLRVELQAAAGSSSGSSSGESMQVWCVHRGQFLPLASRAAATAVLGSAAWSGGAGGAIGQRDLQVVTGLLDASPGLLLLQAEQHVQLRRASSAGPGPAAAAAAAAAGQTPDAEADDFGCMSGLVPVLLCPSAAMAAEMHVHLAMTDNPSGVAPKVLHAGLVLDFWAMHQRQQQGHLAGSPQAEWQAGLLRNPRYLKAIKSMGTQLLLYAVINGMSATSAHLHTIMLALRGLQATQVAAAAAAEEPAVAAAAEEEEAAVAAAAAAEQAAPVAAAADAAAGAADAAAGAADAAAGAAADAAVQHGAMAAEAEPAAVPASAEEGRSPSPAPAAAEARGATVQEAGSSAAAARKSVQNWVFEDVMCKGSSGCGDVGDISSSSSGEGSSFKPPRKPGGRTAADAVAGAGAADGQQSPYVVFRGAAQMLAMLLLMYLLLQVCAAVYKGHSPIAQLRSALSQVNDLLGIMLVPLAMMCLGGVLAIWQFGFSEGPAQPGQQQQRVQLHGSGKRDPAAGKAAGKSAAELTPDAAGVACSS